ncbi:Anti-sigma F factor antagonist [Nonomuraea coxensis DSM 45129]|uniref:Anti-sigma F factor antagonist n=1 Tax=Nonomuraea coxensis DSM 45129 TaxID=1122611 RepID=A0ABX8U056_9ACTN|nr:STAS domain-containing protein [Nonomuraea coxensis]QYC41043.1 Anti-sigma F factor antagonist [Nonomuraea coxensis DSM 45129]
MSPSAGGRLEIGDRVTGDRVVVVTVRGPLDLDTCPALQVALARALTVREPPLLAIDLSGLTSADSYGLTVLLATERHVRTAGGGLVVFGVGPLPRRIFRDRGLDRFLDIQPTLAEAVRRLEDGPLL